MTEGMIERARRIVAEQQDREGLAVDLAEALLAEHDARVQAEQERDVLHSWEGLLSLLDEHYPPDVFDGSSGDPGPRLVVLTRRVAVLEAALRTIADGAWNVGTNRGLSVDDLGPSVRDFARAALEGNTDA